MYGIWIGLKFERAKKKQRTFKFKNIVRIFKLIMFFKWRFPVERGFFNSETLELKPNEKPEGFDVKSNT